MASQGQEGNEGNEHLLWPVGYMVSNVAIYAVNFHHHKSTLLPHVQLVSPSTAHTYLANQSDPRYDNCDPTLMHDFTFDFPELHEVLVSPLLQFVKDLLNSDSTSQHMDCFLQLSVMHELDEVAH